MSSYSESSQAGQTNNIVLPQRTRARLQREVVSLIKKPPEGIILVVDSETGLPQSLNEIMVRPFIDVVIHDPVTAIFQF
jgi:hypothetical protein